MGSFEDSNVVAIYPEDIITVSGTTKRLTKEEEMQLEVDEKKREHKYFIPVPFGGF